MLLDGVSSVSPSSLYDPENFPLQMGNTCMHVLLLLVHAPRANHWTQILVRLLAYTPNVAPHISLRASRFAIAGLGLLVELIT